MRNLGRLGSLLYGDSETVSPVQRALRKAHATLLAARGSYELTLDGRSVEFSAPTATMVQRNCTRFAVERSELVAVLDEIRADDVVYDIGANTGLYSLFAAHECPDGGVVAFEPYPPNVDLCRQDIARNGFQNVEVLDLALSDSVGTVEFSQPEDADVGYGSASIDATDATEAEATMDVPTTTGDNLIADGEIPPPNVVKIDVEGAEPLVVEGLSDALSTPDCRVVYCEVHLPGVDKRPSIDEFGSTPEAFRNRLAELGFTVEELHSRRDAEVVYRATR